MHGTQSSLESPRLRDILYQLPQAFSCILALELLCSLTKGRETNHNTAHKLTCHLPTVKLLTANARQFICRKSELGDV